MLWEYIKAHMAQYPDQMLHWRTECVSYGQLIEETEKLAGQLTRQKYGIACASDLNYIKALLACFAAKVTAVPMCGESEELHNREIIDSCKVQYILIDEGNVIRERQIEWAETGEYVDAAMIVCTSGSTGHPKGVILSGKAVTAQLEDINADGVPNVNDRVLLTRGMHYIGTIIGDVLLSFISGAELFCASGRFQPEKIIGMMADYRITVYSATPTMLYYIARMKRRSHAALRLRYCKSMGEAMTDAVLKEFRKSFPNVQVRNVYGMTEACGRVASRICDGSEGAGCIGRPIPQIKCRIIDEAGKPVSCGRPGQLLIKGETLMNGYYLQEEQIGNILKDGWLYTGDLASMDASGKLYTKSRKDQMIIRGGVNIYPAEIEDALRSCAGVKNAVVFGRREGGVTEKIIALVEPAAEIGTEQEKQCFGVAVMQACASKLPRNRRPDEIRVKDRLSFTGGGKVKKTYEEDVSE